MDFTQWCGIPKNTKISTYVHCLHIELNSMTASDIFIKTRTERTLNKGFSTVSTQVFWIHPNLQKTYFILHIVICNSGALYLAWGSGFSNSFYMVFAVFTCQVNALYCNLSWIFIRASEFLRKWNYTFWQVCSVVSSCLSIYFTSNAWRELGVSICILLLSQYKSCI